MKKIKKIKKSRKVSEEQFFSILRENAGIYARTARAIQNQFGIKYSRQAVKDRAEKYPEILEDIGEENLDIAEEGLQSLMRSKNEQIKFRAIELTLKTKGKKRGYIEKSEVDVKSDIPQLIINVIESEKENIIKKTCLD